MNQRKHGTRLLGLLVVAALSVMAFAANAQAIVPGFLIGKLPFVTLTKVQATLEPGTVGKMLVPGLNFELNCTTMTTDQGAIESKADAVAVLLFTGCTTLSITKLPEEIHCHVTEPIKAEALILPAELKAPTLNAPALLAENIKALIKLHLPEASLGVTPCVLPLDNIVTGEVCFEIKNGTNDTVEPLLFANSTDKGVPATVECKERLALEAAEGAGVKDVLKYGAQTVTLDGAAKLLSVNPLHGFLGVSLY
jgi:hypothetical protein